MANRVLITGATGLVGTKLIEMLLAQGYQVTILSRKKKHIDGVRTCLWDIENRFIEPKAFEDVDTIIHLAGEGIAEKRWTTKRKNELIASRVASANLLFEIVAQQKLPIKTFISASAVGYYGNRGDTLLDESATPGTDFLADCCIKWEKAAKQFESLNIRTLRIRIGVILSKNGGALASLEKPIKYFLGTPLGNGRQWVPWIHLDDVAGIFIHAVKNENIQGVYNACAPEPATHKTLVKMVAKTLKRPIWQFTVPSAILRIVLGEMATVVTNSDKTSAQKILDANYNFEHDNLAEALQTIYG